MSVAVRGARLRGRRPGRGLGHTLAARLATAALSVLGAAALASTLLALAPGDAADLAATEAHARAHLRAAWQLDGSVPERVLGTLGRWARGDLGTSWTVRPGAPVTELLPDRALRSLGLLTGSLGLALAGGVALALAAPRWRSPVALVRLTSVAPAFLLAHLSIVGLNEATFALMQRGLIERPAWFALPDTPSALRTALAVVALALGSGMLADVQDTLARELRRIRGSAWVEAARARGEAPVLPILTNLVPALCTLIAGRVAWLAGGLVVIEQVLQIGGAGALFWRAAELRDHELAAALALLAACFVASVRFACDAARAIVDPRVGAARVG